MTGSSEVGKQALERKLRLALLGGGSVVGIVLGCLVGYLVHHYRHRAQELQPGASFENLDDLRRAMLGHDERDTGPNSNVSLRSLVQPDPSDLIIYRLRPNLDITFHDVPVHINSFGMRGPETTREKPAGVYRIALLGDSFAFGWGVDEQKIFARVIERELNQKLPNGPRVEVLNFGVPGYSTFQEVALFQADGIRFQPDAVMVYFIDNDFGLPFFIKDLSKPGELARDAQFSTMRAADEKDVDRDSKNRELLSHIDPNRAILKLSKLADEHGFKAFVVLNPGPHVTREETKLWALRRVTNVPIMRLKREVQAMIQEQGLAPEQLQLANDPHPSAIKHQILGDVMTRQLAEELWGLK